MSGIPEKEYIGILGSMDIEKIAAFPFLWYAKKEKTGNLCMKRQKRSNANTDRAAKWRHKAGR